MPVEGPLGVRSMDYKQGERIVSAVRTSYEWNQTIQWAECSSPLSHDHLITPPYDHKEFPQWPEKIVRMDFGKNCGIWAATDILIIHSEYADYQTGSVLFLVEGLGTVMLYTEGWRASGVEIIAVVKPQFFNQKQLGAYHPYELRMIAAADKFNVPIIDEGVAEIAILKQMDRFIKGSDYDLTNESTDPFKIEDSEGMRV